MWPLSSILAWGFQRQSLKPLSADSGTLLTKRSFEGLGELFSRRKVPLNCIHSAIVPPQIFRWNICGSSITIPQKVSLSSEQAPLSPIILLRKKSVARSAVLPLRKKSRSAQLFAYKCAHTASLSLPTFCGFFVLILNVRIIGDINFLRYSDTASANMSPAYLRRWKSISGKVKGKLFSWKSFPYTLQKSFCLRDFALCGERFGTLSRSPAAFWKRRAKTFGLTLQALSLKSDPSDFS